MIAALGAVLIGFLYARRGSAPQIEGASEQPGPQPDPEDTAPDAAQALLDVLEPEPKQRILQLGLAEDELTFAVAERVKPGKVEVLDSEQEAVDGVAQRARTRGLSNVSGWHGDPKALLFEENRFDAAFVPGSAGSKAVKRELARVVKPGGRLVVSEGDGYVATPVAPADG